MIFSQLLIFIYYVCWYRNAESSNKIKLFIASFSFETEYANECVLQSKQTWNIFVSVYIHDEGMMIWWHNEGFIAKNVYKILSNAEKGCERGYE